MIINIEYGREPVDHGNEDEDFYDYYEKPVTFEEHIKHVLKHDNKDEFVELINSVPCPPFSLVQLWEYMFQWDSVDCAAAVLANTTEISNNDPTSCLSPDTSNLLHKAAAWNAFRITALLRLYGFSADARLDFISKDESPLGVVLSKLRYYLRWRVCDLRKRPSAVKFLISLYMSSPSLFATLALLVQMSREVKREFFNYLKEGKMIEVGALLAVHRSWLKPSSTAKGEYDFELGSMSDMHDFLMDEIISYKSTKKYLRDNSSSLLHYDQKLIEMEETLLLLNIFDKIGDKLWALLQIDFERTDINFRPSKAVISLLEDAGFDVKAEYHYPPFYHYRPKAESYKTDVLLRVDEDCRKTAVTKYALRSTLKGASRGFADESGKPFLLEAVPEMNHVTMSAAASVSPMLENIPIMHFLKRCAPFLGALKRVL